MNPTPTTDTQRLRELHGRTLADWEPPDEMHKRDAAFFTAIHREAPALLDEIDRLREQMVQQNTRNANAIKEGLRYLDERDKLREEVASLRSKLYIEAENLTETLRDLNATREEVERLRKKTAELEDLLSSEDDHLGIVVRDRDSLRRENEELKAKLK